MHWKPIAIDKLEKKPESRSAHVAWGAVLVFLVSRLGLHPGFALLASILAGLAWEWGYAWVKSLRKEQATEVLQDVLGWPRLSPRTYVTVEKATARTATVGRWKPSPWAGIEEDTSEGQARPLYTPAPLAACGEMKARRWTLEVVLWRGNQACNRNNPSLIDWLAWIIGGVAAGAVLVWT